MRPKPCKEIIIDGFKINNKVSYDIPDSLSINHAYVLYRAGGYPAYIKKEVKERYGENIEITIVASKHNSFKKDLRENPQWF